MAENKTVNIKKIVLEYDNGTKLILNESRTPTVGKLFFDSVRSHEDMQWEIIQKNNIVKGIVNRIVKFFSL